MANAIDVAKYITEKQGSISAMKLQKLVYYSQAWALVWDDEPIFPQKIEAWANGPVVRELYDIHRGMFKVSEKTFAEGNTENIGTVHKETINVVLEAVGNKSAQWLSDLTHAERPWIEARKGLDDSERGSHEITLESMADYYGSL